MESEQVKQSKNNEEFKADESPIKQVSKEQKLKGNEGEEENNGS